MRFGPVAEDASQWRDQAESVTGPSVLSFVGVGPWDEGTEFQVPVEADDSQLAERRPGQPFVIDASYVQGPHHS